MLRPGRPSANTSYLGETPRSAAPTIQVVPGASTPEELETLLEDAFVVRDREALAGLFEPTAVVAHHGRCAREADLAPFLAYLWRAGVTYVARPPVVIQARDTALILAGRTVSVAHRDTSACWRFAIKAIDMEACQP
jgi:hypothetical protein